MLAIATPAAETAAANGDAVTTRLVELALELVHSGVPADVQEIGRQCVLDWLGCSLAAINEPLSAMVLALAESEGSHAVATIIGSPRRASPRQAALVNGTYGHALDFDDMSPAMAGHPTAAILPAVLAAAEADGANGELTLCAFIAGYETAARVGRLVAPGHYARGFHATGTVGAMAAAVACSAVMKLDADATRRSVGIAASLAAGLKANFATMCKPLHAGRASENGLLAAQLARRGFTARTDILERAQGFAATHGPDFKPEAALREPPSGFYILDNLFKYSAACFGTHGTIEALRRLRSQHGFRPEDVEQVLLCTSKATDTMCNIVLPATGLEAKFSLRCIAALVLLGVDTASPQTFSDATATHVDVRSMQARVEVTPMGEDWPRYLTQATVRTRDGREFRTEVDTDQPARDLAAQGARLQEKFLSLASPALGADQAQRLCAAVRSFETVADLRDLMALTHSPA